MPRGGHDHGDEPTADVTTNEPVRSGSPCPVSNHCNTLVQHTIYQDCVKPVPGDVDDVSSSHSNSEISIAPSPMAYDICNMSA